LSLTLLVSGEQLAQFYKNNNSTIRVKKQSERLQLLIKDRADYFIGTVTSLGKIPSMKEINMSEKPIYNQGVALGISGKSSCKKLLPEINKIIKTHLPYTST
jgi:hypothetical protein